MTRKAEQQQRDDELLDVLPAWSAALTAIATGGAALITQGIDPKVAALIGLAAGSGAIYVAVWQRSIQRRVDARNKATPSPKQQLDAEQSATLIDSLRTTLAAKERDYAALLAQRINETRGDTLPACAAERAASTSEDTADGTLPTTQSRSG